MDRITIQRLRVVIRGAVQGVGFRPFVYRLATEMALPGWVINSSQGVFIEVEGASAQLDEFLRRVEHEKPPRSFIQSLESSFLDPLGFTGFEIRHSEETGVKTALVLPDMATCPDCLHDVSDPTNRRYQYPFTNCTNCGPRYSIIEALPYDRPNTSMKAFALCDDCRAEYENPLDRRFHAQPNACPKCGPHLELWDREGRVLATHHDALLQAAEAIRRGQLVAMKGLGGFHLVVDARNETSVRRLRQRKHREEKPLALMAPGLESVKELCLVSAQEERLLISPESPIVLLQRRSAGVKPAPTNDQVAPTALAPSVAPPPNPSLGVMLPYTPLHHLLMRELGFPIVATSGNLSDEPICIDEHEALERLRDIADIFLVHNRPIVRHVDDSIVRVVLGREMVQRRARGYAPLPVMVKQDEGRKTEDGPEQKPGFLTQSPISNPQSPPSTSIVNRQSSILAVGAHLKNSVAITVGQNVFISQHIGDLETPQAFDAFRRVIADLSKLYDFHPTAIACDLHPDYISTHYARELAAQTDPPLPVIAVQHHFAHVASCMAENDITGRALGVSWDGTGYGADGTIWGGEFLLTESPGTFTRVGHLRTFRLPGGDKAVREPRRIALGLLYELFGDATFTKTNLPPLIDTTNAERSIIRQMLRQKLNAPVTSSAGRLFDAVAALIGLRQRVNFEGQAAMDLEFAAEAAPTEEIYDFRIDDLRLTTNPALESSIVNHQSSMTVSPESPIPNPQSPLIIDWQPLILAIIEDAQRGVASGEIAAKFHNTLAQIIVKMAEQVGEERVVLSGGVFQNKYLLERAVRQLQAAGFHPYWHQRVPSNDGGIALGQAVVAMCQLSGQNNEHLH
jgi:hydrogenase maturation protein HypF